MGNPYFDFQIEGAGDTRRFELSRELPDILVGRSSECQWLVASGSVSRRHARVRWQGEEVTIEDLGSSNGTFVNEEKITAPRKLCSEDRIKLGTTEIQFTIPPPEVAPDAMATMMLSPNAGPAAEPHTSTTMGRTGKTPTAPLPLPIDDGLTSVAAVREETTARTPADRPPRRAASPSLVELAMIALASFAVVFGIGAALLRF